MDLNLLRYFRQAARSGSLTAAARALRVSQPTLSGAVKRLEGELGTTLFLRHRGGVTLTEAGAELVRHVDEVMLLLDAATERIAGLSDDLTGTFVIGCHEALGAYYLPSLLNRVKEAAPDVTVSLHNASSSAVLQAVVDRKIHFGVVVNPRPHPELVMREMFRDAIDIFTAMGGGRDELPPADEYGPAGAACQDLEHARQLLREQPLIYPDRVTECLSLVDELRRSGADPGRELLCGDFTLAKSLALAGVGTALLPRRIAREGTPGLLCRLHASLPIYEDIIYLVFRSDYHRTRGSVFLKDELLSCGASMPSVGVRAERT